MRLTLLRYLVTVAVLIGAAASAEAERLILGHTGEEATGHGITGAIVGYFASPASSGTADSIYVYIDFTWSDYEDYYIKCGLYTGYPLSNDLDTVTTTNLRTFNGSSDGWYGFDLRDEDIASDANYAIVAWGKRSFFADDNAVVMKGVSSGDTLLNHSAEHPNWPDPLTGYGLGANYRVSIYCVYNTSEEAISPRRRRIMGAGK